MTDYLPLIIVFGIAIFFLLKKIQENRSRSQNPAVFRSASFWPKINISLGFTIFLAIIVLIALWGFYTFGPPNRDYRFSSQEDFNRYCTCSGTCTVSGGNVVLWGTMTLKEAPDFGMIEVIPASPVNTLTINVGPYIFEYYQSTYSRASWRDNDFFHRAHIYYGSKAIGIDYVEIPVTKNNDFPHSIKVKSSWWNQVFDGYVPGGDPSVYLDDYVIMAGLRAQRVTPLPIQGKISITGQGVNIMEVKINHQNLLKRLEILGIDI